MSTNLTGSSIPPWGLAVAGATGAVLANTLVYPLDIVKTRLQVQSKKQIISQNNTSDVQHYNGTIHAIQSIVEREGLAGLYSGMAGSLIGVASQNFAYFYWYSIIRSIHAARAIPGTKSSTMVELSIGAVAGALAQLFTIPIAVVTTQQQTQLPGEKKDMFDTAMGIVNSDDGWSGLWRGMKASLVLVINPSITYGAYERLKTILYPSKTSLAPHEAFLLGAMSKALATLVTQPMIVAKVGLQSKPPPARAGRPFKTFVEVMRYIIKHEGVMGLFKGIGPQLLKGLLVQGLLMMTKERIELLFLLLFRYFRGLQKNKAQLFTHVITLSPRKLMPLTVR